MDPDPNCLWIARIASWMDLSFLSWADMRGPLSTPRATRKPAEHHVPLSGMSAPRWLSVRAPDATGP